MKKQFYLFLLCSLTAGRAISGPSHTTAGNRQVINPAPLSFIENRGQVTDQDRKPRSDIQFMVPAADGLSIFIGEGAIHYQFSAKKEMKNGEQAAYDMRRMDVQLLGANTNAKVIKEGKLGYTENYFAKNGGAHGTAHSYERILYKDVYPHIDWVLYRRGDQLEHEFIVRPGGKVSNIKIRYEGCDDLKLNDKGQLIVSAPQGRITESTPVAFEKSGKAIKSSYRLSGKVLSYDVDKYQGEMIIDPGLVWATYYGGSNDDAGVSVAVDKTGNIFMSGYTKSVSAIATTGAFQSTYGGGTYDDFIVKLNNAGTRIWATYFGGTGAEGGGILTIDGAGNVYMCGFTTSVAGISTTGAFQDTFGGGDYDAFLVKVNSDGVEKWATYFGGSGDEFGWGVATDASGNVYMVGQTTSAGGIATAGSYQDTISVGVSNAPDAFLVKFDSLGARQWATYYGGGDRDFGFGVATDLSGNVFITGNTASLDLPASAGAYQSGNAGGTYDAFLAKFNSSGTRLWGTYYGGSNDDEANAVVTDSAGNVYFAGSSSSLANIASPVAYSTTIAGSYDGFLVKMSSAGAREWGTYFGGSNYDVVQAMTIDDSGSVYMTGYTSSTDLGTTPDAYQAVYGGGTGDAFLARFDSAGAIKWATYYGGAAQESGEGVTASGSNIYVTGFTLSSAGIATAGAYQATYAGGSTYGDAFLATFTNNSLGVKANEAVLKEVVHIYPNPATDVFTIEAPVSGKFVIYTIDGSEVNSYRLNKGKTVIDFPASVASGMYSCYFYGDDGYRETVKLICNH